MSQFCERCGKWDDECSCGKTTKPKPKPTYEELTAENERLTRVVEQATKGLVIAPGGIMRSNWITGQMEPSGLFIDGSPDLFAQLKGVDRG
jgi:hypothetical protein